MPKRIPAFIVPRRMALCCAVIAAAALSSCSRLGWGVLLWSTEDPPIPSGTVLPVYIRSAISQVWVVGIPEDYRGGQGIDKMEIPLPRLELAGSRRAAQKRAEAFSLYAGTYAEILQDGLPVRENPDNSSRRVYRLRIGEIIKILEKVEGTPAVSTTGDPLPGDWFLVLAEDGTRGYCFSYRLRLFEHQGGKLAPQTDAREEEDPDLDRLLEKKWSPESYGTMVNNRRIVIEDLARQWGFFPGNETGTARIFLSDVVRTFTYTGIRSEGGRSWRFEGSSLRMSLRSDTLLAVQYTEPGGALRTLLFVSLSMDVDDIIVQESARRDGLFRAIYDTGPVYMSNNYGILSFTEQGIFTWTGNDLLVPGIIPPGIPVGTVSMDLFLSPAMQERYTGAFSFRFDGQGETPVARFMYALDARGLRLEYVPDTSLEGNLVRRRSSSPVVLYFAPTEL
ncbi:MAG: SH3 domain-containing protein [Treponema sp.]|nr:SH3 domain-containing protein [Treponema sp.]